jgi:hypothetical protein
LVKLGFRVGDPSFWLCRPRLLYYLGVELVDPLPARVVALESVAVGQTICCSHDADPPGSLPAQAIFLVLDRHHLVREATLSKIEVERVHTDKSWQKHICELVFAFESVSEHKACSLARVCVQIDVDLQIQKLLCMHQRVLGCEDRRLVSWTRVQVVAIEVLGFAVESIIASVDAVRVEHRDDFEDELVHQHLGLGALLVLSILSGQEVEDSVEHIRGRGLSRVNSRGQEYDGLVVELEWSRALLGQERLLRESFLPPGGFVLMT